MRQTTLVNDKICDQVRAALSNSIHDVHATANYYPSNMVYEIVVRHMTNVIFKETIPACDGSVLYDYIGKIKDIIDDYLVSYNKLMIKCDHSIEEVKVPQSSFKIVDHGFGACSYQSVGYTRYCWVWFDIVGTHRQWLRFYWNRDDIKLDKIKDTLERDRKNRVYEDSIGDNNPPNCFLVDDSLETMVMSFIDGNEKLLNMAKNLPLNRLGTREDTEWSIVIKLRQGDDLVPCTNGTSGNPDADLWIVIIDNNNQYTNKIVKGFGMSLRDSGAKAFNLEKADRQSPFIDVDEVSIIKSNRFHAQYQYKITDPVREDDEYLPMILKENMPSDVSGSR